MTSMMIALVKANVVQQLTDYKKYVDEQYLGSSDKTNAHSLVFDNRSFERAFTSKK